MKQLEILRQKRDEIYRIARKHKAEKVYIFGSCARGEETPKSDIDFLVRFTSDSSLFDLLRLETSFKRYFKRNVDVVAEDGINPFIRTNILREAVEL